MYVSLQAYTSTKFQVLWYKRDHSIGFKRKTGDKKQIMSFSSKTSSGEVMRKLADRCLPKLDAGEAVADVKQWALNQLQSE